MEAKHSHSSTCSPEGPKQQDSFQESTNSHQSPSQSSQTYTGAPSGTGDGASGQSMTATTADFDPIAYQATLDHQYSPISSPDQRRDLTHIGFCLTTIEPFDDTLIIGNDFIQCPTHQACPTVNTTNAGNGLARPGAEGENTEKEAVELFRASLHRKV